MKSLRETEVAIFGKKVQKAQCESWINTKRTEDMQTLQSAPTFFQSRNNLSRPKIYFKSIEKTAVYRDAVIAKRNLKKMSKVPEEE